MCGIFGIVNDQTNDAAQTVLAGLKKLEYRGYDSWGIAIKPLQSTVIQVEKHVGKIGEATTKLPKGNIAIGHTRWATHGGVTDRNAHPHLDCNQKIAVLHNGIVENHQELREKLKSRGHKFISETDTEVIAHLTEENRKKNDLIEAVFATFNDLSGLNAIGVLDWQTETLIACRYGSPLVIGIGNKEYFFASDVTAFLHKTNKVIYMNDGEGVVLNKKGIKLFDLKTGKSKRTKIQVIDWKISDAEKGGYPHFLLKEINEQKETIIKASLINEKEIETIASKIRNGYQIVMLGCGTASFCTIAAKYFFANLGIKAEAYGAYEFIPFVKFCHSKTIIIAVSQSGETADTLIAVKKAKEKGTIIVAVINSRGSTLERLADVVLPVGAGPEIAVISTKAYTSQLATLYLLANAVNNNYQKAQLKIRQFNQVLNNWFNNRLQQQIIKLAKLLLDHEDIYLIGKYLQYPASLEFALKIKETSYIHSEAFASGELKHGVIALIQKGTPCIVLTANDDTKYEILSSAMELKARGGFIIGIGPYRAKEFDYWIATPNIDNGMAIFFNVIIGQLLGYYLGIGRGTDPDKPRNLAKSVTVK